MRTLFLSLVAVCSLAQAVRAEDDEEGATTEESAEERTEVPDWLSGTLVQEEGEWTEAKATRASPPDQAERKARLRKLLKECDIEYGLADANGAPKMEYDKRVTWKARVHFRLPHETPKADDAGLKILNAIKWKLPANRQISLKRAVWGRGSCEEIGYLTQRLIDAGKLATDAQGGWGPQLRKTMWDHGIGVDCVGYVGWALMRAWGRDDLGSGVVGTGILGGFGFATNKKFKKLAGPADAESGDVIDLDNPAGERFGHLVVVAEHRVMTSEEATSAFGANDFFDEGPIHDFVVHSSWGASGMWNSKHGGVGERRWLYNETTDKWADVDDTMKKLQIKHNPAGPYDGHPVLGVYRPK